MIGNKNLTKANASYQLINQVGDLIGPILAGIMITILGGYRTLWFQETVPSNMLGRVLSFSRVFTRLAMTLGMMVGSLVSNSISPVVVFTIAAV